MVLVFVYLVACALVFVASAGDLSIPPSLKFGAATAAYQVEGAWNISGKGESIWDRFTHSRPDLIEDRSNGDVACDSFHHYKKDIQLIKSLGLNFYRFSISWPRLMPTGFPNNISEDGITFYSNVIDELLRNGIEPLVTLYHWDLPQILQDYGGWTNPLVADWFADYARLVYSLYADRVKTWLTINEPLIHCDLTYNTGLLAPGVHDREHMAYHCGKNTLIAHAKAWRIYDQEFKPKYHGKVSIANQLIWQEPLSSKYNELGDFANQYVNGRYAHPIYSKEGGWPPGVESLISRNSKGQGFTRSRLPAFTQKEIELIRGTHDFFAFNHYTSRVVYPARPGDVIEPFPLEGIPELNVKMDIRPNWKYGTAKILPVYPEGIRKMLNWVVQKYGQMEILITECGYSSSGAELNDDVRIQFIRDYLEQVLLAIKEDGVNVTGFTYWTLIDNFEWFSGYKTKFGLYQVDFSSPLRTRTPRKSALYYRSVIANRTLDLAPIPDLDGAALKNSSPLSATNHPQYWTTLVHIVSIMLLLLT